MLLTNRSAMAFVRGARTGVLIMAEMCAMAAESMRQASRALLTADLQLAERVLAGDAELDRARRECEDHAQALLALQAPVAGDLRTILAAVYCAEKIERMGDLAAHIADTARFTHPEHAVPAEFESVFTELGEIAAGMADRVGELIASDAGGGFAELDETDEAVDALHARVLTLITGEGWQHGVRSATSLALVARFYERFADQAVSVAKRLEFAETGQTPTSGA
jgi:phosphate transport system protein